VTAALGARAADFVPEAHACTLLKPESPTQFVPDAQVIVLGTVVSADDTALVLKPEVFLKGPVSQDNLRFTKSLPGGQGSVGCPTALLAAGQRAVVYVFDASSGEWPLTNQVYVLDQGRARMEGDKDRTEAEVVNAIRAVTGQYAVPASNQGEGAGIDWKSTILPLGIALAIIFAIGLVLMRLWHRIDPS
jgi:hypothetical protein